MAFAVLLFTDDVDDVSCFNIFIIYTEPIDIFFYDIHDLYIHNYRCPVALMLNNAIQ